MVACVEEEISVENDITVYMMIFSWVVGKYLTYVLFRSDILKVMSITEMLISTIPVIDIAIMAY